MEDLKLQIFKLTSGFVDQLSVLTRRHAEGVLVSAFSDAIGSPTTGGRRGASSAPRPEESPALDRARSAKRDPSELEQLATRFSSFVKEHPGLRIEQIKKELGVTTAELALPIRKLIASGAISTQGQKRSTTYFVGRSARGRSGRRGKASRGKRGGRSRSKK